MECKHCKKKIYQWSGSLYLHCDNHTDSCDIKNPNSPKAEPEEKPMPKEMTEYRFKVVRYDDIDIKRIASENPYSELIIVIPDEFDDKIIVYVDSNFQERHPVIKENLWHESHYTCHYNVKSAISSIIERYKSLKAQDIKVKKRHTITVKCFGNTLPF